MADSPIPDTAARRADFYARLAPRAMAPLWEVLRGLVAPEPRPTAVAHLWPYDQVRPLLMEAGALLTAEEAERRVLVLENPAFPGASRATATLYAGIQLVLPGEVAPAHRHVASALRFVLESGGGHTAVQGERTTMRPGDFVTTPSWAWHDHGNDSGAPVTWLDVLDIPLVNTFQAGFSQHHDQMAQALGRPEGDALARFGNAMLPMDGVSPHGASSPIFNYPFARARESLAAMVAAGGLDPYWAATLRYANPLDGGWAMPTIAAWMTHLPAGTATLPMRSTDGLVVACTQGRGVARSGDTRLAFGPRDVFVLPNWTWRSFQAEEDCFLFCASDRAAQQKLGFFREELLPA